MVKNTHGGSGHKSQARKNVSNPKQSSKLRLMNPDDEEVYAQVLSILGGGICSVICHDEIERLCIIRGKFRGKGKRDNTLYKGCWILVGLRTWAGTSTKGKEQCDLLEIYSESDKKKLQVAEPNVRWCRFITNDSTNAFNTKVEQNDVDFTDEQTDEYFHLMKQTNTNLMLTLSSANDDIEEIDIEDI
jgi:hypothetical protein